MKNIIVVLLVAVAVYTYRRKDWGRCRYDRKAWYAGFNRCHRHGVCHGLL